jgi:1-deoxy-D-xylulose-5-phosphate synthase
VAEDGTTHHGAFDFAFLRHVPNMVVMAPKDENELQHMVKTCFSYEGPASVRYSRGSAWGVPMDAEPTALPIGQGELLREGHDVALIAIGITVLPALQAAERLAEEGISAAVVNARFVKPLDHALIARVAGRAKCLMTVEEGCRMGGFGSAVLESLSEQGIGNLPTKVVGLPDQYVEQGPQDLLRAQHGLTADGIYEEAKDLLTKAGLQVGERS